MNEFENHNTINKSNYLKKNLFLLKNTFNTSEDKKNKK